MNKRAIHLIAIGGSAMHNLAIALHRKGFEVSGSDDEIFEPSRSRLANCGLLPACDGWFPEKVHTGLEAVILGMHARKDNPELLRAMELRLPVYSYPEYLYEQSKDKKRIVVGGSHGKTSITAMILHVLNHCGVDADYMVGAQLEGFDCMVRFTESAPVAVLEGDEYLSSPIDPRPKFHLYRPHVAVLSGIAWDHINVFPTWESYLEQFSIYLDKIEPGGSLIYCAADEAVAHLVAGHKGTFHREPYEAHPHHINQGITVLESTHGPVPLKIFGLHNLQNLNAARLACAHAGVNDEDFYKAIQSFTGASRRLELLASRDSTAIFRDFAHSPSKLKATTKAVKQQYPERQLVACMELHTFSSLNKDFLNQYEGSMKDADVAVVYFNPHTIAHKKLEGISADDVKKAFGVDQLQVFTDSAELKQWLYSLNLAGSNLLLMTSGNFDGLSLAELAQQLIGKHTI